MRPNDQSHPYSWQQTGSLVAIGIMAIGDEWTTMHASDEAWPIYRLTLSRC